jgi:hypothetical protein
MLDKVLYEVDNDVFIITHISFNNCCVVVVVVVVVV